MSRRAPALAAAVLALVAGAAAAASTPGVTRTEILIGGTAALSGADAAAANRSEGAAAYFRYVNAHGGVHGRTIVYEALDDGADPELALRNVTRLVEREHVFAIFGGSGAAADSSIRDYLNAAGVPQLFVGSGAAALGSNRSPWTLGYAPTYRGEGDAYAKAIRAELPDATVGVLYAADSYGRELRAGLERGLGTKRTQVAAGEAVDPSATDVTQQVAALQASGADVLCVFAGGELSLQALREAARLGWRPQVFVGGASAAPSLMRRAPRALAEGAISIAYLKDPASAAWADDPGVALYRSILRRYGKGADPEDGATMAGMASAFTLVDTLRRAGAAPTRTSVIEAAAGLDEVNNPFLLPGIAVRTTPARRRPISQVQFRRWTKGRWRLVGGVLRVRP